MKKVTIYVVMLGLFCQFVLPLALGATGDVASQEDRIAYNLCMEDAAISGNEQIARVDCASKYL